MLAQKIKAASYFEDGFEVAWLKMVLDELITLEQLGDSAYGIKQMNDLYGLKGKRRIRRRRMHKIDAILSVLLQELIERARHTHSILCATLEKERGKIWNLTEGQTGKPSLLTRRQCLRLFYDSLKICTGDGNLDVISQLISLPRLGDSLMAIVVWQTWWTTLGCSFMSNKQKPNMLGNTPTHDDTLQQLFVNNVENTKIDKILAVLSKWREAETGSPKKTLAYLERGLSLYISDKQRQNMHLERNSNLQAVLERPEEMGLRAFSACPGEQMFLETFAQGTTPQGPDAQGILSHPMPKQEMSREEVGSILSAIDNTCKTMANYTQQMGANAQAAEAAYQQQMRQQRENWQKHQQQQHQHHQQQQQQQHQQQQQQQRQQQQQQQQQQHRQANAQAWGQAPAQAGWSQAGWTAAPA